MTRSSLMRGFPPAPTDQVTSDNWTKAPWNRWAFLNTRRLFPTAAIRPAVVPSEFQRDPHNLASLAFEDPNGAETSVARALSDTETDGLIVLRGGRIAFEWYDGAFDAVGEHIVFSVSKSILGAVTGTLVDSGLVDPSATVTSYVPELDGSAYAGCTVRDCLDMTVGIAFSEEYADPAGDVARFRTAAGLARAHQPGQEPIGLRAFLATLRSDGSPHGQVFHYVSPNTDVVGWVLERAAGRPYPEIVADEVWGPMGAAREANITLDRFGVGRPSGGISTSLRDLARFGEMMRNRGLVDGRRVVPGWWIDDIRRNGDRQAWARGKMVEIFPNAAYRSQWYNIAPTVFCAVGVHGQWIYVDEAAEAVIVRLSSQPDAMDLDKDRLWLRGYHAIAGAVS